MHRLLLAATLLLAAPTQDTDRIEAPPQRAQAAHADNPARRFDFWPGTWSVTLRTIQPDHTFQDSIQATAHIYSILDGKAVLELWNSEPIKGFSLRHHDPQANEWILWLDWPRENHSTLNSLTGAFRHGRGDFYRQFENPQGEEILARYSFNDITPFSLRWDDAYSRDGGQTWTRNWIMEFTRTAVEPVWPIPRNDVPTFTDGTRCTGGVFRPYEAIAGAWQAPGGATLTAYRILDGCAVMAFFDSPDGAAGDEFLFLTRDTTREHWLTAVLGAGPQTGLARYTSDTDWTQPSTDTGDTLAWTVAGDELTYSRGDRAITFLRQTPPGSAALIPIPDARIPMPGVLSGGQPTRGQIEQAAAAGFATVINMRTSAESGFEWEPDLVEQLGMRYVSIPVAGAGGLTRDTVETLDRALAEAREAGSPVLLHCGSGNRIGAVLALREAWLEGADPEAALAYGKQSGLTRLEPATRKLLGLEDAPAGDD